MLEWIVHVGSGQIYNESKVQANLLYIEGIKVELFVDSNAVISIFNYQTLESYWQTCKLFKLKVELTVYTGHSICVFVCTKASVICGIACVLEFDFEFVDERDNLIGIDFLDALKLTI